MPDESFRNMIQTPGRMLSAGGLAAGLVLAVFFGLLIGQTQLSTIILLSSGLVFITLLIGAGEYWWGLLVVIAAFAFTSTALGFRLTGFEMGFSAVMVAYLIRSALRAIRTIPPPVGLGLAFSALFTFLLLHCILMMTYSRYESPDALKNIARGYYSALAPLAFLWLLGKHCQPATVKPVVVVLVAISVFTTLVAIPVFIFGLDSAYLLDLPVNFQWLDPEYAIVNLRSAPLLAIFAVALWPTMRTAPRRWLLVGLIALSLVAGAASSGRLAFASIFLVILLFGILNRKWLMMGCATFGLAVLVTVITIRPELLDSLPDTAQRALSPLNLSHSHLHDDTELSDKWHEELRTDSLKYWTENYAVFFFGHGFSGWDYRLSGEEMWTRDFEYAKSLAIRMGKTENAFSAITNIFGLTGLLLYAWFVLYLTKQLWAARTLSPPRSFARAMCEVSLVSMAMFVLLIPLQGSIPAWEIFYWQLGLLAARPYLPGAAAPAAEAVAARPTIPPRRRREPVGAGPTRSRFAPAKPRRP